MTRPVTYLEIHSADPERSLAFLRDVFDWAFTPFAAPGYLVAPAGDAPGIDTGLLQSRDGSPRAVPVIRVPGLDAAMAATTGGGGSVVVPPFTISGVGRGCYITDPTGVLLGLHEYDPDLR